MNGEIYDMNTVVLLPGSWMDCSCDITDVISVGIFWGVNDIKLVSS